MDSRILIAGAVALGLCAAPAVAQEAETPAAPVFPQGPLQFDPTLNRFVLQTPTGLAQFDFVPGVGFVPVSPLAFNQFGPNNFAVGFDAFGNPIGPFASRGFSSNFAANTGLGGNLFVPGFVPAGGFFGNPFVFTSGSRVPVLSGPTMITRGGVVPTLGVNVPPTIIARQQARVPRETVATIAGNATPRGVTAPGDRALPSDSLPDTAPRFARNGARTEVRQRVAGARQEIRIAETPAEPAVDAQEARALRRAETMMMNNRPLTEARVERVGATGVIVQVGNSGAIERYPLDQAFFFENDGTLTTAATRPALLEPGIDVLVPMRDPAMTRGNGTVIGTTVVVEPRVRTEPMIQSRVAGSRQTIRSSPRGSRGAVRRRPAR